MDQIIAQIFGPHGYFGYWQLILLVVVVALVIVWLVMRQRQ